MDQVTIEPAVGHAPVSQNGGVGTSPGYDAIDHRRAFAAGLHEGVVSSAAWLVHEDTGSDLTVVVDADVAGAHVQGDTVSDQGVYYVPAHTAAIDFNVESIAPPDPTNPRIDRVWLQVFDDTHDGSGENEAVLVYEPGTPTSGATLDNEDGAPALPATAVEFATVQIPAAASEITNSNIRDKRPAGGARKFEVGQVIYKGSSNAPFGCLAADGSTVKRNVYAELFTDYGTTHGAGDGSTTFNLPDHRSRSAMGAGTGTGLSARTVGQKVGEETHELSTAEMPAHSHAVDDPGHDHTIFDRDANFMVSGTAGGSNLTTGGAFEQEGVSATDNNPTGISLNDTGGGGAHNNMQPSIGLQAYVYTGKA